jgi:SAM-dependent methyltransferase
MTAAPPRLFDRALHRAHLDRAARNYGQGGFLKTRAAEDAADRLSAVLHDFPLAVDLGARDGALARALIGTPAQTRIGTLIEADLSSKMLRSNPAQHFRNPRLVCDEERLPFAQASLDLVVSLLSLHWTSDLVGALVQIRRALKPDGLFMGALFGGATLTELRQSLLAAEAEVSDGAGLRVSPFADGFDAAGLLQRAGFALPVADVDRVTVNYDHPLNLLADLRAMGETNALADRARKPLSRMVLARMCEIYQERFGLPDGRIPATFEIISAAGWVPHPSQQQPLKPGSAKMRLADALHAVEHKLPRE